MVKALEKRNEECIAIKNDVATKKMLELKELILDSAREELRKVENQQIAAKKMQERAMRDAAIAAKKKEEGNADEQDARIAEFKPSNAQIEENTWTRGANV